MAVDSVAPVRVLYAEDNAYDADLTRAYFAANTPGFTLDVVDTGEECLTRLGRRHHDVLLLDNHLPDMDGLELMRQLASRSIFLPVVMTTSVGDEALAVQVLQLGVCDYVPKDGDYLARLPTVLKNAIADYRKRREQQSVVAGCGQRILYVEHDASDVDLTIRCLAEVAPHFIVECATSGAAALARLGDADFSLVLADLRMLDMSALDLLREAKQRGLRVPFIVITGGGDEAAAVAALKLGAYDYIVKRDDYLMRLPYAMDNAITRFQLARANEELRRELAARQRLQQTTAETMELLATLQKHAPIGIAFLDREYRYQRVNDELAAINGLPAEAHLGHAIAEVVPDIWQAIEPIARRVLGGEAVSKLEISGTTPAGPAERHFIASIYPVRGLLEEVVGVGVAMAEITDRKRAEDALREHVAALAEAGREKDEFLAMLSHELRNPIAPIRTALELLRRAPVQDEVSVSAHDVIDRQVTHMVRLLDDLLDVARLTSGRITLKVDTVDIRRVVGDAIESVGPLIVARRHRLETSLPTRPLSVAGDTTRLVQVLVNLLNNAAKYTDEGGTISLSATTHGNQAVLRVADTGIGIPRRLLPRIFDLFTQDDRTLDRAQGGLGLGLTLVRRITELHGGSVEAHSAGRGQGSEFIVRLPLHLGDEAASTPPGAADPVRFPSQRCLVVEDNVDAARMLELALTLEGHEVRVAFDGRDAITAAAAFRPDAVILDIGLPRMNGYDAARSMRQLPGMADVLIIGLTGYGQAADHERSREAGFDDHLVKPIELDTLLKALAAPRRRSPDD